ncbi:hypothetical protein BU23DRAFT_638742 [Bimuria novae-zelandiae CBS 107.79]|uniref:Uncharacterized protein n=1 Tax=Bimuria novae-zelandiae CBS 107.79 TaxID=1447943 RepID=A0A6A5VKW7_9PLEO|nr:hypothetical protein BU23DRAFT_638742 [Bimuria novae-zelandiae CBS 107.79]
MNMPKKDISSFFRKLVGRKGKSDDDRTGRGASVPISSCDPAQQLGPVESSNSMPTLGPVPQFDPPTLGPIQQVSPIRLPSAIEFLPPSRRRYSVRSRAHVPSRPRPSPIIESENEFDDRGLPEFVVEENHARSIIPSIHPYSKATFRTESYFVPKPTPSQQPMMSDAAFFLLPEYTGSSDDIVRPRSVTANGVHRTVVERPQEASSSTSSSWSSFACRGLSPIKPPISDDHDQSRVSSDYHIAQTPVEDVFSSSIHRPQEYRQTQSSPLKTNGTYSLTRPRQHYPLNDGTRSSPTAVVRTAIRKGNNRISYSFVPERRSSLGKTSMRPNFERRNARLVSQDRPTPSMFRAMAQTGPIKTLYYRPSPPSCIHVPRTACRAPSSPMQPSVGVSQYSSLPMPCSDPRTPVRMKVTLPPSYLGEIFTSSEQQRTVPAIPSVFLRDAEPPVPSIFRKLLETPPGTPPHRRTNDRLPRGNGIMDLREICPTPRWTSDCGRADQVILEQTSGNRQSRYVRFRESAPEIVGGSIGNKQAHSGGHKTLTDGEGWSENDWSDQSESGGRDGTNEVSADWESTSSTEQDMDEGIVQEEWLQDPYDRSGA